MTAERLSLCQATFPEQLRVERTLFYWVRVLLSKSNAVFRPGQFYCYVRCFQGRQTHALESVNASVHLFPCILLYHKPQLTAVPNILLGSQGRIKWILTTGLSTSHKVIWEVDGITLRASVMWAPQPAVIWALCVIGWCSHVKPWAMHEDYVWSVLQCYQTQSLWYMYFPGYLGVLQQPSNVVTTKYHLNDYY